MGTLMAIPQITLVEPCDSVQLEWLIRELQNAYGVFYIRMLRKLADGIYEKGSTLDVYKRQEAEAQISHVSGSADIETSALLF